MSESTKPGFTAEEQVPESERKRNALVDVWKPASDLGPWFSEIPPGRDWLLQRDRRGVLPLGKVGMVAAPGGAGKSWAVSQLALAVTTGRDWLGFNVDRTGAVLLILGEEEADEARRRLFYAAAAMKLGREEREMAAARLWVLPMAGRSMALTRELDRAQSDDLPVTPMAEELERRLKETTPPVPWRLVVLDPLSRFAGGDVEKDNAAATRFVQVLERMAHLGPTVLVTHHTTKIARSQDAVAKTDAAATIAARGASGLTDGVRWVATLSGRPRVDGQRLSELAVTKSNYGWTPDPVILVAEESANGALRVATDDEVRHYEASTEGGKNDKTKAPKRRSIPTDPEDDQEPNAFS